METRYKHPFICESEFPPEHVPPRKFTDGETVWEEPADPDYYEEGEPELHEQTIEQQFKSRGMYNVPRRVIDRLEEEAARIRQGITSHVTEGINPQPEDFASATEFGHVQGYITEEVNLPPLNETYLDKLVRAELMENVTLRGVYQEYKTAVGLGADPEGLSLGVTDEEFRAVVMYTSYYDPSSDIRDESTKSFRVYRDSKLFGNKKDFIITRP